MFERLEAIKVRYEQLTEELSKPEVLGDYNKLKKLYNIYNSGDRKNIYINNGLMYTMYNNKIFGVSLEVLEYCGIKRDKVLALLDSNPSNRLFYNTSRGLNKLSRFLGNKKYAIPYFISSISLGLVLPKAYFFVQPEIFVNVKTGILFPFERSSFPTEKSVATS
jgi:hypothetical protein